VFFQFEKVDNRPPLCKLGVCDPFSAIILIFDEIITGSWHNIGGYQKICGVKPDITTIGKAIANGYPAAAICGREDLMRRFNTAGGDVFFAGTYNASIPKHPVYDAGCLRKLIVSDIEETTHATTSRWIVHFCKSDIFCACAIQLSCNFLKIRINS
jgi:hypothetical protein